MKHMILAAAVALALTRPAAALDENGKFNAFFNLTCKEWNVARFDRSEHLIRTAYLAGYFSAMNYFVPGKKNWLAGISLEMAVQATYEYCKDRPDWTGARAVQFLGHRLKNGLPIIP